MIEIRVRNQISDDELALKIGKIVTEDDYNVLLTGPTKVWSPTNRLICVYLPGALSGPNLDDAYPTLHELKKLTTENRGLAGGTERVVVGEQKRSRGKKISSAIVGAIDPGGQQRYCRLTAWTGQEFDKYQQIHPLLQDISTLFEQYVPERFKTQMEYVGRTDPSWIIPGTPFTTVTVNNTYPTGVHQDKGDLDVGFSTLACLRRGSYNGGTFTFPRYRLGVNMRDGDLLLMDAHEWHGNTAIEPLTEDAERVSVVSYYRTKMEQCGTPEQEVARAQGFHDKKVTV